MMIECAKKFIDCVNSKAFVNLYKSKNPMMKYNIHIRKPLFWKNSKKKTTSDALTFTWCMHSTASWVDVNACTSVWSEVSSNGCAFGHHFCFFFILFSIRVLYVLLVRCLPSKLSYNERHCFQTSVAYFWRTESMFSETVCVCVTKLYFDRVFQIVKETHTWITFVFCPTLQWNPNKIFINFIFVASCEY